MNKIIFLNDFQKNELMNNQKSVENFFEGFLLKPFEIENNKKIIPIEFMPCYSHSHFHLIVKIPQLNLVKRDRSYQNGDGFHFVLANPKENNEPSDEFYVIAVSPEEEKIFIWYKNIDFIGKKLEDSIIKYHKTDENLFLILSIPWKELAPLKSFFVEKYGFNLSYVQAIEDGKNVYIFEEDDKIQSEQSLRKYIVFDFEKPEGFNTFEYSLRLNRCHFDFNDNIFLELYALNPQNDEIEITVKQEDNILLSKKIKEDNQILNKVYELSKTFLKEGFNELNIEIKIEEKCFEEKIDFFVYSEKEYNNLFEKIDVSIENNFLSAESRISLLYYCKMISEKIKNIKSYEKFDEIYNLKVFTEEMIKEYEKNGDIFIKGKVNHLAHLSNIDNTYQPYSLYVPTKKSDKLLIYLHGSGSDDKSVVNAKYLLKFAEENNIIILAPFSRGTSHFYCSKDSLLETKEIMDKIIKLFNINKNEVYLSGFSMGGYGVLRVYDEYPVFKAIIMISGHHSIGTYFDGYDYSKEEKMKIFKDVPFIAFHGKEDNNCSFKEVNVFFEKMKKENKNFDFIVSENLGHSGLTEEWYEDLCNWYKNTFANI